MKVSNLIVLILVAVFYFTASTAKDNQEDIIAFADSSDEESILIHFRGRRSPHKKGKEALVEGGSTDEGCNKGEEEGKGKGKSEEGNGESEEEKGKSEEGKGKSAEEEKGKSEEEKGKSEEEKGKSEEEKGKSEEEKGKSEEEKEKSEEEKGEPEKGSDDF